MIPSLYLLRDFKKENWRPRLYWNIYVKWQKYRWWAGDHRIISESCDVKLDPKLLNLVARLTGPQNLEFNNWAAWRSANTNSFFHSSKCLLLLISFLRSAIPFSLYLLVSQLLQHASIAKRKSWGVAHSRPSMLDLGIYKNQGLSIWRALD